MHLNGENCYNVIYLKGKTCRKWANGLKIFCDSKKKIGPQGFVCPHPGAIYMYITIIFKDLFLRNHLANQIQILYEASIGKGNQCLYK